MQLVLRIDDDNYAVVSCRVSRSTDSESSHAFEVDAVALTDGKFTNITKDQLLDLVGYCVDDLTTVQQPEAVKKDWRDAFVTNDTEFFQSTFKEAKDNGSG